MTPAPGDSPFHLETHEQAARRCTARRRAWAMVRRLLHWRRTSRRQRAAEGERA